MCLFIVLFLGSVTFSYEAFVDFQQSSPFYFLIDGKSPFVYDDDSTTGTS
jgi:hypothetical protein